MTSNRTMIILIVAVFVLGVIVVYTNSKIETAAEGELVYCAVQDYSFCDEFDSAGMDTSKWQSLVEPDYLNNWIQRGDGVISGNLKAATIPAYSDFTYETKMNMGFRSDIVMRYIDENNYYAFLVRSAGTDGSVYGRIVPYSKLNGMENYYDPIFDDKNNTFIMGNDYVLKITAQGSNFSFYVNGQLLGNWSDPQGLFSSGRIGFYATNVQETIYDYVHIVDDSVAAGDTSLPGKVWRLLTQGAGKSGKTPKGIQDAPGLYKNSNDKTPPQITSVNAQKANETTVEITWYTDEDSNGVVIYTAVPGLYEKLMRGTTESMDGKFLHKVGLTDLAPGTNYYFKVLSADSADNFTITDEMNYSGE